LPGALEEDRLPALYSGALALLYPSFYEGFGLPLLEAMQCGCPVVASNAGALREVSGGAALHLDANDPQAWAEAMRSLAASPGLREQMREDGLQRAAQFSWARTARLTREVYEEARRMF
jgi:glycosyltransferase involved in cell wall biosynthesis